MQTWPGAGLLSLLRQLLFFRCLCAKAQLDSARAEGREWRLHGLNTVV